MLSAAMAAALKAPRRDLCWLGWFETSGDPLYAWTGMRPLSWDGQTWLGVGGPMLSLGTVDRGDMTTFRQQTFSLNGLDPDQLAPMDASVRGLGAKLWLAALDDYGQIIADPLLMKDLVQDFMTREIEPAGTVRLTLTCYEALPRFDRATGRKWSHESQMARHAGDYGFYYTQQIARTGPQIDWRPST